MIRCRPTMLPLLALVCALTVAGCATSGSERPSPSGPYVSGGAGYATH